MRPHQKPAPQSLRTERVGLVQWKGESFAAMARSEGFLPHHLRERKCVGSKKLYVPSTTKLQI
eukprot:1149591-Pelagomonas_calceolata.AAC.4